MNVNGERKPYATKGLDFHKTRQVGQDPGNDLENRNGKVFASLEMNGRGQFEALCKSVRRRGAGIRFSEGKPGPPFTIYGI